MDPANDPAVNSREIVRDGYDRCAEAYAAARARDDSDQLACLLALLADDSCVLDVGCGAGVPIAQTLARWHRVTGVDISERMLRLARAAVPKARLILGDILSVELQHGGFDAVVAMYVLFHVPREQHRDVFRRVWAWLRPGGYFLATLSEFAEEPYTEDDFFGVRMYWSCLGWSDYEDLLRSSGFEVLRVRSVGHGYGRTYQGRDERHPLVLARKRCAEVSPS